MAAICTRIVPFSGKERRGEVMRLHGRTIQPIARVTRVRWPGGVWEWHRPVAVEVREAGGVRRIPIRDTSGIVVVALVAVGCAIGVVGARALRRPPSVRRMRGEP